MAFTDFQKSVCRLIATNRREAGESYVAGGVALNLATGGARISRDIDLFHDTEEALQATWDRDRELLESNGFVTEILRERPYFVEAEISLGQNSVLMQWARDSAFRFFPLVPDDDLGLVLHPFDLATNKVLALVGRLEVRDWIDIISCDETIQPLGYLAWAACGKDPGFTPGLILEQAGRSSHYSAEELGSLSFADTPPDLAVLSCNWHRILSDAERTIALLPAEEVGKCLLTRDGLLFAGNEDELNAGLQEGGVTFHAGSILGAFPHVVSK